MEMQNAIRSFTTIKIIGVSGVGKTTAIEGTLRIRTDIRHACFSRYLSTCGHEAAARMGRDIRTADALVLMDEHLEFGDGHLSTTYREENTVGLFVITADPTEILKRRLGDRTRHREMDVEKIAWEQARSCSRAARLASELSLPIATAHGGSPANNVAMLLSFIALSEYRHRGRSSTAPQLPNRHFAAT